LLIGFVRTYFTYKYKRKDNDNTDTATRIIKFFSLYFVKYTPYGNTL
jgi:hypothetical protein